MICKDIKKCKTSLLSLNSLQTTLGGNTYTYALAFIAAVTNYYKLSGLKQYMSSQCRSDIWHWSRIKSKGWHGCVSFGGAKGRISFSILSRFKRMPSFFTLWSPSFISNLHFCSHPGSLSENSWERFSDEMGSTLIAQANFPSQGP